MHSMYQIKESLYIVKKCQSEQFCCLQGRYLWSMDREAYQQPPHSIFIQSGCIRHINSIKGALGILAGGVVVAIRSNMFESLFKSLQVV